MVSGLTIASLILFSFEQFSRSSVGEVGGHDVHVSFVPCTRCVFGDEIRVERRQLVYYLNDLTAYK